MYDPKIARFLQEDTYTGTAGDPLSLNLYTYCVNNPLIYYDPTGHMYADLDINGKWIGGYTHSVNPPSFTTGGWNDNNQYEYGSLSSGTKIVIATRPSVECDITFGNPFEGFQILTDPQRREEAFALIDEYASDDQKNLAVSSASTADISYGMLKASVGTLYQQVRYEGALILNDWGVVSDTTFNTIKQERSEHFRMFNDKAIIEGIIKSGVNLYNNGYKIFDVDAPTSERTELLDDAFVVVTTARSAFSLAKVSSTASTANNGAKYVGYVKNAFGNAKFAVKNMLSNRTGSIGPKNKLFKNSRYSNNKVSGNSGVSGNTQRGYISGDPGILKQKVKLAKNGDVSAAAELRVAKQLRNEGYDVHFVDDMAGGRTNDFTINGSLQVDVKRISGIGRNAAGDLAQGVRQVGPGGQVIVVRPSNANFTIDQYQDFVNNFKPQQPGVTFRVIDESVLPK